MSTETPPYQPYPGQQPPVPTQKSGMALAAMVIGIVAIVLSFIPILGVVSFLLGPLAVIFGIVALVKKRGKGQAITGIITGAVSFIVIMLGTLLFGAAVLSIDEEMQRQDQLEEEIEEDAEAAGEEDAEIDEIEEEVAEDEAPADDSTGEWVEVESLSGTGDQRGEVFTIDNDARISYEFSADDEDFSMGVIYLMKEGDSLDEDGGIPEVMIDGSDSGETMAYQTGEVYLDVGATGYGSWTVTVEEQQ